MKVKLTELAKTLGKTFAELDAIRIEKLTPQEWTGKGRNTWLTLEGAQKVRLAVEIPLAVPVNRTGYVIHDANNPNWVYAKIEGMEGKHPVAIPRRYRGKLVGKNIPIHVIQDAKGTTFRHAMLTGRNH